MKLHYKSKASFYLQKRLSTNYFKSYITAILFVFALISSQGLIAQAGSASATYSAGDVATDHLGNFTSPSSSDDSSCFETLTVSIPPDKIITGVDVSYEMSTDEWMSELRSRIKAVGGQAESSYFSGTGNSAGTQPFSRSDLSIANDITGGGNIDFEMHAFRTYGGSGCGTSIAVVDNSSWIVTVYYDDPPTCITPKNLAVSNITASSADLSWDAEATATTGYDYFVTSDGTIPDETTTPAGSVASGTTTASLTSLTANTDYNIYVRSDCGGGDESDWSSVVSFRTFGDCASTGTFDYVDNSDASNSVGFIANTPGDYITLEFTAGSTESCCDDWYIKDAADGSGNTIATGSGSIVGSYESTTGEISFYVDSDGSV